MVLIFIYFICSIPYTKIKKLRKFEQMILSHVTFDLYAYHDHTQLLAAGAKCKSSSWNDISLWVICQGVETE